MRDDTTFGDDDRSPAAARVEHERRHRPCDVRADRVMVTRQEIITSLHEPNKFILAIV